MTGTDGVLKVIVKYAVIVAAITILFYNVMRIRQTSEYSDVKCDEHKYYEIIRSRNKLSAQLNDMRKSFGQLECQSSKKSTSEQGGWCRESSKENGGNHLTDKKLIPKLSEFFMYKHVASFGDGPGAYKRDILKLGQVKSYTAYDGAPFCEETSEGRVKFLDLTIPQYGIPIYDWIISLEVAEHIPEKYEAIYLDNIFRHAKEGIILSWAVPGQGGLQHVNNKPLSHVINVMVNNGFYHNATLSRNLQLAASLPWLRSNTNVYFRKNNNEFESKIGEIN